MKVAERKRLEKISIHEKRLKGLGFQLIAGIDEAGRGPLAGPVVAAACILPERALFENLNDSKQLTPEERAVLFEKIISFPNLIFGIGISDVAAIDQMNILRATLAAMKKAVDMLAVKPDYLLVDGNQLPSIDIQKEYLIEGDAKSVSIAAASIIAKVTRDRMMVELDSSWPQYGFAQHKGYATEQHREAIQKYGPCPIHRKSFDPVKSMLGNKQIDFLD